MNSKTYASYLKNCDYPYTGIDAAEKYLINKIRKNPLKRLINFLDFGLTELRIEILASQDRVDVSYRNMYKCRRNIINNWVYNNMFELLPYSDNFRYSRMWA